MLLDVLLQGLDGNAVPLDEMMDHLELVVEVKVMYLLLLLDPAFLRESNSRILKRRLAAMVEQKVFNGCALEEVGAGEIGVDLCHY